MRTGAQLSFAVENALVFWVFYTIYRGSDPSFTLGSKVLLLPNSEGLVFKFSVRENALKVYGVGRSLRRSGQLLDVCRLRNARLHRGVARTYR